MLTIDDQMLRRAVLAVADFPSSGLDARLPQPDGADCIAAVHGVE